MVVAGTGAQPTEITFGDEFGQGVPKAVYTGVLTPVQITLPGLVQGVVRLQGQATSLGGYVAVGDEVHFLDAAGRFSFPWGGGPADVWIKAPGHLPVVIPQANVAAGTVLTIPELTLPFGDANGDGRIDVLDLSMAAANFGDVTKPMPLPP